MGDGVGDTVFCCRGDKLCVCLVEEEVEVASSTDHPSVHPSPPGVIVGCSLQYLAAYGAVQYL